ncbi:hypothetical protein [Ulvibacter antarcticus]|uniref:Uncharacterized protein n=1 Tax=Ulvibacter antarcticus TaxID=442714 RepID=A0A3L9Z2G3_9FLAO|nr:hypothetical protein [Ulvibacter antarcticus]RMA64485.1 hypothetical protein BXY75_1361 [Ulvibacter antarcticus]
MKTITCSIAAILFSVGAIYAQENVDVKKETTTKTVVVKDTNVETTVINDVNTEESIIQVNDNNAVNQDATVVTKKNVTSEMVEDKVTPNAPNDADVKSYTKKEVMKTDAAIKEQKAANQAGMNQDQQDVQDAEDMTAPKTNVKKVKNDN